MKIDLLYRGPLSSCNFACSYCPFAKRQESRTQLQRDRLALSRFVEWLTRQSDHEFGVLFTPWGEALVRAWYRRAIAMLSRLSNVRLVSVQTNLSAPLAWLGDCRSERVALWASYHPSEVSRKFFLAQVARARKHGARISVGMVATPESLEEAEQFRQELPAEIPFWLNAERPPRRPYTEAELARLIRLDPTFDVTRRRARTRGLECQTGETSLTVDGDGVLRRCHFVDTPIGNLYSDDWLENLQERACPRGTCECFLGLVNVPSLGLAQQYKQDWIARSRQSAP